MSRPTQQRAETCANPDYHQPMAATTMPAATAQITYEDLYARWEKGNWCATEIDFSQDRIDWHERMTPEQRDGAPCGSSRCSSTARTRSPTTSRPTSTPRRWRSRSTSWPPSRSTRRATRCSSSASSTRSSARAATAPSAARWRATEQLLTVGAPQDVRPPRRGRRRAAQGPLAAQLRRRDHDVPHDRRGRARPADAAQDRRGADRARRAAGLPRGHAQRLARRAAPHRASACACSPTSTSPTPSRHQRRRSSRRSARSLPWTTAVALPPDRDLAYTECDRHRPARPLRGGRAADGAAAAGDRPAARHDRALPAAARPAAPRARRARPEAAGGGDARARRRPGRRATPRRWRSSWTRCAASADPGGAPAGTTVQWEFADAEPWFLRLDNGATAIERGRAAAARRHAADDLRRLRRRRRRARGCRGG